MVALTNRQTAGFDETRYCVHCVNTHNISLYEYTQYFSIETLFCVHCVNTHKSSLYDFILFNTLQHTVNTIHSRRRSDLKHWISRFGGFPANSFE